MNLDDKGINSHVVEYLDYYCDLEYPPEFAVLLKGEWGAGKTWFIKKYQKKLQQVQKKEKKKKCFYVSLYGMTDFNQITTALFLQQLPPVFSIRRVKLFGGAIAGFVNNLVYRPDVNSDGRIDGTATFSVPSSSLVEAFTILNGSILIFDDLERCGIDIVNVLGYINNFVEHQNLKVIIIADENKLFINKEDNPSANKKDDQSLKKEESNSYGLIKEKLIGKTLTINLDFEGAAKSFIELVKKSEKVEEFLSSKIGLIKDIYQIAKYQNLRTLRQIVLDFKRIYESLPKKAKSNLEALEVLLQLLIVFSIEIKANEIKSTDIGELYEKYQSTLNKSYQALSLNKNQESEQEEPLLQKLFLKYGAFSLNSQRFLDLPFPSFAWWGEFLDKGILDKDKLAESIISSGYFPDENTPDWIKLWHYYDLNDDKFENLFNKVELEYSLKNNTEESIDIKEIQQVLGLFLVFSDAGLYSKSKQEILESFKIYTKNMNENNKLNIPFLYASSFLRETKTYTRLGFQGDNFKEFKDFSTYIQEVCKEAISNDLPSVAQKLLNVMGEDAWKFYKMLVKEDYKTVGEKDLPVWDEENGKYAEVPVLKYVEEAFFLEKFLQLSHKNKRIICFALNKRYDSEKRDLLEELNWLKRISTSIQQEAASKKGKLSGYLLDSLIEEYFNKTINKIEIYAQNEEIEIDL